MAPCLCGQGTAQAALGLRGKIITTRTVTEQPAHAPCQPAGRTAPLRFPAGDAAALPRPTRQVPAGRCPWAAHHPWTPDCALEHSASANTVSPPGEGHGVPEPQRDGRAALCSRSHTCEPAVTPGGSDCKGLQDVWGGEEARGRGGRRAGGEGSHLLPGRNSGQQEVPHCPVALGEPAHHPRASRPQGGNGVPSRG